MCGIVAAVADREVVDILLAGLKSLEYRGYDSAGVAIKNQQGEITRVRRLGKVACLQQALSDNPVAGRMGIAHTRWATHGAPSEQNAHPHMSGDKLALIHNGIIENHDRLRSELTAKSYSFVTDTDSEVIAHLVDDYWQQTGDFLAAVRSAVTQLEGAYSLAIMHADQDEIIAVRHSSPLVIGLGIGENFVASDPLALMPVAQKFIFLQDGDLAVIKKDHVTIYNQTGDVVERESKTLDYSHDQVDRGQYRHYMQKEIFQQPEAILATLEGRLGSDDILPGIFGVDGDRILQQVQSVHIIACGTSYYAGLVARFWIEELIGLPCQVEVASEYRYRQIVVPENCLFVSISQSGETADTLSALHLAQQKGYLATLAICNVPESAIVRESDLVFMTRAGREIGVASTKAFITQLVSLLLLTLSLHTQTKSTDVKATLAALKHLPQLINEVLALDPEIEQLAQMFADKHHSLFLGRGPLYPIALEGALKLKEISYIHAEAYPAGELKHGPLALVDRDMPVIAVAPKNDLLEKLKSNLHEVRARGGQLVVFAEKGMVFDRGESIPKVIELPAVTDLLAPIVYVVPLQLLAYHVAVLKGTDVDQPRNLAKSVTVE